MIPPMLDEVAKASGWKLPRLQHRRNGDQLITLFHPGEKITIDIKYNRWRHTTARAYRGRALTAILTGQRAVADFLAT